MQADSTRAPIAPLCSFLFAARASLSACSCCCKSSEGWIRPCYF